MWRTRGRKMAIANGEVRSARGKASGILIEVFAVPGDFQRHLPIKDRKSLSDLSPTRLGSALTDNGGRFSIEYAHPDEREQRLFSARGTINLWLVASAAGKDKQLAIIHQEPDVRRRSGLVETFTILLDAEALPPTTTRPAPGANVITPAKLTVNLEARAALSDHLFDLSKITRAKQATVRKAFRDDIAPHLAQELSTVADSEDDIDPDFVRAGISVRRHAETRIKSAVEASFSVNASEPMVLSGRVSLTDAQMERIEATGEFDDDSVTIGEDELEQILNEDGEGTNPEAGQGSVTRLDAIAAYCRQQTRGEQCLFGEVGNDGPEEDGPGDGGDGDDPPEPQPDDNGNRLGQGITQEDLKDGIPTYIARILDEDSVLDSGFGGLPGPGDQLNEDDVGNATAFPSLSLPPGPADVPAFYDFHDLQIAFKPVWMEALDDSLIDDAEAAYERYVELGGDPETVRSAPNWTAVIGQFDVTMSVLKNKPPEIVSRYIDITAEEWTALQSEHQGQLRGIATDIDNLYAVMKTHSWYVHSARGYVTKNGLIRFERTHKYIETKVGDLMSQAQRVVRFARGEIEQQVGAKSPVPSHRILTALKSRALSHYPATFFAANRKERSVNFGLLLTYRQRWEPTAYQVGELIKSIPLAPKEIRKYSKKIVMKEKRARKEVEANVENLKSETNSTSRGEAEIVQKAMDKTNFNATAKGSFKIGIADVSGSTSLTQDAENNSAETKKSFHEAVVKAARDYKTEFKVELETESTFESEFEESGELVNPNDELSVTYLFYELQRRYRVTERLHRLTSVVLVAQEVPSPADVDEDWLIAHRWILNRVLLDDGFKQPLMYVAEGMVAEEHALTEMRKSLEQQRNLVNDLKEDVAESRELTESRYGALQRSMERSAQATQRKKSGGGLFGFVKKLTGLGPVGDFTDRLFGNKEETPEAARIREAATRDAYERELQRLRDLEGRFGAANSSLARATEEYTERLSAHLANVVLVTELKNHVKDNIVHYMQAVWLHEPEDQRWLRLKDVPVPVFERNARNLIINRRAQSASLANVVHLGTRIHGFAATAEVKPPPPEGKLPTVPLYQVADLGSLLGFKANYMIFAMKKANALTDFMMEPFVDRAAGGFGITDPDDLGNMTLDEFSDYVCCLKENLEPADFDALMETLKGQLKKLLQSPLRDDEEIIVPFDAMYIEALPGTKPILENFKLLHRQIDAADAQEELRLKKMEKLRYAQRLLTDVVEDPEADARYVFDGAPAATIVTPNTNSDSDGN